MPIERLGPEDRAVPLCDTPPIVGLSLSTIKREIGDPSSDFPRPFHLTKYRKAIMLSDLLSWVERKAKAAKPLPAPGPAPARPQRRRTEAEAA